MSAVAEIRTKTAKATAPAADLPNGKILLRLTTFVGPNIRLLLLVMLLAVLSGGAAALSPYFIGHAVDYSIPQHDTNDLLFTLLEVAAVILVGVVIQIFQTYLLADLSQRSLRRMQVAMMTKLNGMDVAYFDRHLSGDLISRVSNDLNKVGNLFGQGLTEALGAVVRLTIVLIAMLTLDWRLALVSFLIIPATFWAMIFVSRRTVATSVAIRSTLSALTTSLQQEMSGIRVTQSLNRSDIAVAKFQEINSRNRLANIAGVPWSEATTPITNILGAASLVIVLGVGTWLVSQGLSNVGVIVAFLLYVQQFNYPIQSAANLYNTAQGAVASTARIFEVLDLQETIKDKPDATKLGELAGNVEFRDVAFGYNPGQPAIQEISFTIPAGKTLAIVGSSGAGKSTLVNLLSRLYEVDKGAVLVDGHDVRDVTQQSLRNQMAIILQQSTLFSGTIASNIRFGRLDATDDEIKDAAKAVEAHEFIMHLPKGYDTPIGARGNMLSEGQRQQILFARALIRDPRILILDEATSTLDPKTEQLIQGALGRLLANRTSLVVAHRFSTIQNADEIIVMDKGRIVERGTHAELAAAGGIYANLLAQQTHKPSMAALTPDELASIPLFSDLSSETLERLVPLFKVERFNTGETVVQHGDFGGNFYIINKGGMEVVVPNGDGERQVASLVPHDYFGEIALLGNERRTATVRAITPSSVYSLSQSDFADLLEREPEVASRLAQNVVTRRAMLDAPIPEPVGV